MSREREEEKVIASMENVHGDWWTERDKKEFREYVERGRTFDGMVSLADMLVSAQKTVCELRERAQKVQAEIASRVATVSEASAFISALGKDLDIERAQSAEDFERWKKANAGA